MHAAVLITQAVLLIVEYYFYVNDKAVLNNTFRYSPIMEIHIRILFSTLLIEMFFVLILWSTREYNDVIAYFLVASPFLMIVRGVLHIIYLLEVIKPNEERKYK